MEENLISCMAISEGNERLSAKIIYKTTLLKGEVVGSSALFRYDAWVKEEGRLDSLVFGNVHNRGTRQEILVWNIQK